MSDFFNDVLQDDAAGFLELGGEDVVYRPRGGTPRTITALVDRPQPVYVGSGQNVIARKLSITVANDATTGVDAATLDVTGDSFDVADKPGKARTTRKISGDVPTVDAGMITLNLS